VIPQEHIISVFHDKGKRPKGKGKELANTGDLEAIEIDED